MKKIFIIFILFTFTLNKGYLNAGQIIIKNAPSELKINSRKEHKVKYSKNPKIYISPTFREFKLNNGEFSRLVVKIISDKPAKIFTRKRFNNNNVRIVKKIVVNKKPKWVEVFVLLPTLNSGYKEIIEFLNADKKIIQICKIVVKNRQSIYQTTTIRNTKNFNRNNNFSLRHSLRCDKGSWAWRASASLSEDSVSGSFTINW